MNSPTTYLHAIEANLMAMRSILTTALQDIDHGLEAVEQRSQNGAVGSILPAEALLKQASTLFQAILVLHRQS
jgi:hypothetical protein